MANLTLIRLPPELEDGIVAAFGETLAAFRRLCAERGLRCLNFLQPALLIKWSARRTAQLMHRFRAEVRQLQEQAAVAGKPVTSDTAFDIIRRRHNIRLYWGDQDYGAPFAVDWTSAYEKCSELWTKQGIHAFDLSALLANHSEECFLLDGIHYTLTGSRKIASAIAAKLMAPESPDVPSGYRPRRGLEVRAANPHDTERALEQILVRCAEHVQKYPTACAAGWRILDGRLPLAAGEPAAWADLAAELHQLAASTQARPRSFAWETEAGELYPFY